MAISTHIGNGTKAPPANLLEFLSFTLGAGEYGIDVQNVQELRSYGPVTHFANAPDFVKGVVNLSGIIVPIIDMRIKFSLSEATYDTSTVVIILNVAGSVMGIVVDSVSDVTTLTPEQIRPAPEFGSAIDTDHLIGLGTLDERLLILLDIEKLMASDDTNLTHKLNSSEQTLFQSVETSV